jgi:hypothetical protein
MTGFESTSRASARPSRARASRRGRSRARSRNTCPGARRRRRRSRAARPSAGWPCPAGRARPLECDVDFCFHSGSPKAQVTKFKAECKVKRSLARRFKRARPPAHFELGTKLHRHLVLAMTSAKPCSRSGATKRLALRLVDDSAACRRRVRARPTKALGRVGVGGREVGEVRVAVAPRAESA